MTFSNVFNENISLGLDVIHANDKKVEADLCKESVLASDFKHFKL